MLVSVLTPLVTMVRWQGAAVLIRESRSRPPTSPCSFPHLLPAGLAARCVISTPAVGAQEVSGILANIPK